MKLANHRLLALGLALAVSTGAATAKSVDDKTAWGAAAAVAGVGAILEAKDNPTTAALLAAGALYSYTRYDKARRDDRDSRYDDPYGYTRGPSWRPGQGDIRYDSRTREVSGVVTRDTSVFDRKIRVRLDDGQERTFKVPKDARVMRDGRSISIHDVKKDDYVRVRVDRYRSDGDLTPIRVDVLGRYDDRWNDGRWNDDRWDEGRRDNGWDRDTSRNETRGSVVNIDSRNGILRIDVNGRTLRTDVRRAEIRDSRGSMPLRDLQRGDRVTVYGRRDGDTIQATRVVVAY